MPTSSPSAETPCASWRRRFAGQAGSKSEYDQSRHHHHTPRQLRGPRGPGYRRMIEVLAAGRAGTPDEVGTLGALLMGAEGAFVTGSDFLMDGGVTAAYWFGDLAPK